MSHHTTQSDMVNQFFLFEKLTWYNADDPFDSGYRKALEVHHVTPGSLAVSRDVNQRHSKVFGVLRNPQDLPTTVQNSSMYELVTGTCRLHLDIVYPDPHHKSYDPLLPDNDTVLRTIVEAVSEAVRTLPGDRDLSLNVLSPSMALKKADL